MKKLIGAAVVACACAGLVWADSFKSPSNDASVIEALKKNAQAHGDAIVAVDLEKLDQLLADDWKTVAMSGRVVTKENVMADLKSGKDKLEWFELGPMNVQVYGDVAAIHGSVAEKRSWDGKDVSGEFVWMDLLEKRGDRWVIVRSAGGKIR